MAVKTDGTILEWDAETIEERGNEMISWESLPRADNTNPSARESETLNGYVCAGL